MRIVKQANKHNQFNIENLTLARVLAIMNSLEYCRKKGYTTRAGTMLIEALNNQTHKLRLG